MTELSISKKAPDYLEKQIFNTIDFYKSIKNISELIFLVLPKVFFRFSIMFFNEEKQNNLSEQN